MDVDQIEKLEEVLKDHLRPTQRLSDYKLTRLTSPGENYGSLMLRLDVKLLDEQTESEEDLALVAKLLPPNDMLRKLFNIQVTYRNEVNLYKTIAPVLEEFQKEQGAEVVDIFPKFYGARFSLDPDSEEVDDGAVLLLENLKVAGFTTVDRRIGFDLPSARLLIRNLAYFHAIPLALKLKDPNLFEETVKPYLADFVVDNDSMKEDVIENVKNIVKEDDTCIKYLEKIEECLRRKMKIIHEPFATISHNDYWVNNILVKFQNGEPVANKMVDFQVIEYKSPCRDLIFFLFSSVQLAVLKDHVDELIDFYYKSFIEKLEEINCDTAPFSKKAFDKQLELAANEAEYSHLAWMVFPIHADPKDVKELSDMSVDDFTKKRDISPACKDRLVYITKEFIKRGWL